MKDRRNLIPDYLDEDVSDGSYDMTVLPSFVDLKRKTLQALYGLDRNMKYNHALLMDKSPKGSVDEGIRSLVDLINGHPSFSTLSSCSGRISIFDPSYVADSIVGTEDEEPLEYPDQLIGKGHGAWLLSSHEKITFQQLLLALNEHSSRPNSGHALMFKHEPLLLHVAASNMSRGRQMLSLALNLGFRESGLVVTHKRITVAIRSHSLVLNLPISSIGDLRPPDNYLKCLVMEANNRFDINAEKLVRLEKTLERELFTESVDNDENQPVHIKSIQLPELNLWNHSSVSSYSRDGNQEILVFGGQGSGPHNNSKVGRSENIYSLEYKSDAFEYMNWKEIRQSITNQSDIEGFRVRPVNFTAREGHASCSLNMIQDDNVRVHAIFGGRTGPSDAIADLILMVRSEHDDSVSFFAPEDIQGVCPPRWGHTFTALSGKNGNHLALVVGGRDEHDVLCDAYFLSFEKSLEKKGFIWIKLDLEVPRFHHYATILPTLQKYTDVVLISGGLASTSLIPNALHGTSQNAIILYVHPDGRVHLNIIKCTETQTFGGSLSSIQFGDKVLVLRAGGLSSDPSSSAAPYDSELFEVIEESGEFVLKKTAFTLDIDLGSSVHSTIINLDYDIGNSVALLGGGVPSFAFGQSYAKSYIIRIQKASKHTVKALEGSVSRTPCTLSVSKRSVIESKTFSETSVLYVSQKNAKQLKCALEKVNYLDKNYRMVPAQGDFTSYIAVPVNEKCSYEWRQFKTSGATNYDASSWVHLVLDDGTQSVPYSSSRLGNQKTR